MITEDTLQALSWEYLLMLVCVSINRDHRTASNSKGCLVRSRSTNTSRSLMWHVLFVLLCNQIEIRCSGSVKIEGTDLSRVTCSKCRVEHGIPPSNSASCPWPKNSTGFCGWLQLESSMNQCYFSVVVENRTLRACVHFDVLRLCCTDNLCRYVTGLKMMGILIGWAPKFEPASCDECAGRRMARSPPRELRSGFEKTVFTPFIYGGFFLKKRKQLWLMVNLIQKWLFF